MSTFLELLYDIENSLASSDWLIITSLIALFIHTTVMHLKSRRVAARTSKRAFFAIFLSAITIINLWFFIYPSSLEQSITEVSVLTKGSAEDIIKEKVEDSSVINPVFITGIANDYASDNIKSFSDWEELQLPKGTPVKIYGNGINSNQINRFPKQSIEFIASEKLPGFTQIQWTKHIQLGNELKITANFSTKNTDEYHVTLVDPVGQMVAEQNIQNSQFSLVATPKANGLFIYQLIIKNSHNKIIFKENLPVEIYSRALPKTLIIADAPGFEINRLQRFLEQQGIPLATRVKLSKDKYKSSFSLINKISLTKQLPFEQFDLLIIDERSLEQFTEVQLQKVNTASQNFGLGVLVILSEKSEGNPKNFNSWFTTNDSIGKIEAVNLNLSEKVNVSEQIQLSATSRQFTQIDNYDVLIKDSTGKAVAISKSIGNGKLGATRVMDSYRLRASKQNMQLSRYWRILIENISKTEPVSGEIQIINNLPVIDDEITICKTGGTRSQLEIMDSSKIKWQPEMIAVSDVKLCIRFWPKISGWHQITTDDLSRSFYVFDKTQWLAVQQHNKHQQNYDIVNASTRPQDVKLSAPLPRQWILISLLFCLAIVWVEQKF